MADHMVKLGQTAQTRKAYAVKPSTRHMREAPAFIERFSSGDTAHRGDAFWQYWTMAGFRGGNGQDIFYDTEMFHESVGMDGSHSEKLVPFDGWADHLTPAYRDTVSTWASQKYRLRKFATVTDEGDILRQDEVQDLWQVDNCGMQSAGKYAKWYCWRNDPKVPDTGASTMMSGDLQLSVASDLQGANCLTYYRPATLSKGFVVFGTKSGQLRIYRYDSNKLPTDVTSWTTIDSTTSPLVAGSPITALIAWNDKLYVAQNNQIWSWDGSTISTAKKGWSGSPVGKVNAHLTCATTWNGAMYFGGYHSFTGILYRVDGAACVEVARFADNFTIQSLCSYAGSLFIGGASFDTRKGRHVGKVYRFNGASLVELDLGKGGVIRSPMFFHGIWDMEVWDGKLLLPAADYVGLIAYDAAEDAFTRLPRVVSADTPLDEPNWQMATSICVFQGIPFVTFPKHGTFRYTPDVLHGTSEQPLTYYLDTSLFDAGYPLVEKVFYSLSLDLGQWDPRDTVSVYYRTALNGSWIFVGDIGDTANRKLTVHPSGWLQAKGLQLRFDFHFDTVYRTTSEFRGFHVRYILNPEVRRNWSMSLVCADNVEWPDGTACDRTGLQMRDELWALRDGDSFASFQDTDGKTYNVIIQSYAEFQSSVNMDDGFECDVSLQFWEV